MGRKREPLLLGVLALALVLAYAAYRSWTQTSLAPASASNGRGRATRTGDTAKQTTTAQRSSPRVFCANSGGTYRLATTA